MGGQCHLTQGLSSGRWNHSESRQVWLGKAEAPQETPLKLEVTGRDPGSFLPSCLHFMMIRLVTSTHSLYLGSNFHNLGDINFFLNFKSVRGP